MSIFKRIFGSKNEPAKPVEQALIVRIPISDANGAKEEIQQLMDLELKLESAIVEAGVGEFDGNEFGEGEYTYYMYGTDADRLFASVERLLREHNLAKRGVAEVRYGGPDAESRKLALS
jgi:hypothetical protein